MPEKTKRKTTTSTDVKRRYNEKAYSVIAIRVPKEMAEQFKSKCLSAGISQAQVVKEAITAFLSE